MLIWSVPALLLTLTSVPHALTTVCRCGYGVKKQTSGDDEWLFSYALESDFTKVAVGSMGNDWLPQQFNVSALDAHGPLGKIFRRDNIWSRTDNHSRAGSNQASPEDGLYLRVGSNLEEKRVPSAEIDSIRDDLHWGSYRAGMKLTAVKGTCAALFWELDIEFLSKEFDISRKVFPVNLVIQSRQSMAVGSDASKTDTFRRVNLAFDPTEAFHEYRFDYLPGQVVFYANSKILAKFSGESIPTQGGHLVLQHWSNGNPLWSDGPPARDAIVLVSYVKAYFNTSLTHDSTITRNCPDSNNTRTCKVLDIVAGNASTGGHFLNIGQGTGSTFDGDDPKTGNTHKAPSMGDKVIIRKIFVFLLGLAYFI